MAYFKYLIIFVLVVSNTAFAGYAQLKPPPGWSQGMAAAVPGTAGTFAYGLAANGANFRGTTVLTNAALNVAGQLVTVPVSMRLAANAATVAASWSFGNPYLFVAALAFPIAYKMYKDNGLEVQNGVWGRAVKSNTYPACTSNCLEFALTSEGPWFKTVSLAADDYIAKQNISPNVVYAFIRVIGTYTFEYSKKHPTEPQFDMNSRVDLVYRGVTSYPASSGDSFTPLTDPEFHAIADPLFIPIGLPQELPFPLPIQQPVFNPDPAIDPLPYPSPALNPRPLFVPTGNPVPTSDPAIWNQPGIRISPAPIPDSPWRVDVQPENLPQNSPNPKTDAQLNPATNPNPVPNPNAPAPGEKPSPGLCDQYPGIAACAPADKYEPSKDPAKDPAKIPGTPEFCAANPTALMCLKTDTPESDDLEKKDKTIAITPDSGWGSGGGSCPAPRHFSKGEFSFQIYCDFASGIKPVIIAVAWLVAAGILIGFKFGES